MVPDKPWPTTPASTVLYTSTWLTNSDGNWSYSAERPSLELTTWRPLSNAPA